MSTSLPPSARDFQIYQRLLLDAASTRQTAADFSLSQTRVRQIAQHVAHWLAQSLPASSEATDTAWLRLAQHIAADRLQMLYGEAIHGWRATHESKYAGIVLRITAAMGKMPASAGALDALIADAIEGPLPDNFIPSREQTGSRSAETQVPAGERGSTTADPPTPQSEIPNPQSIANPQSPPQSAICNSQFAIRNPQSAIPSPPPLGACSPTATPTSPTSEITLSPPPLTPTQQKTSNNLPASASAARRAFLAPAHAPFGARLPTPPKPPTEGLPTVANSSASITELQLTPQILKLTTKKPLSRRDRRRLRRLAAKS